VLTIGIRVGSFKKSNHWKVNPYSTHGRFGTRYKIFMQRKDLINVKMDKDQEYETSDSSDSESDVEEANISRNPKKRSCKKKGKPLFKQKCEYEEFDPKGEHICDQNEITKLKRENMLLREKLSQILEEK
jgi:hypothetical protein